MLGLGWSTVYHDFPKISKKDQGIKIAHLSVYCESKPSIIENESLLEPLTNKTIFTEDFYLKWSSNILKLNVVMWSLHWLFAKPEIYDKKNTFP